MKLIEKEKGDKKKSTSPVVKQFRKLLNNPVYKKGKIITIF